MEIQDALSAVKPVSVKLDQERRARTVQAWEQWQKTGLHLTHEEADAWLAKLEAGEAAEMPACHR